MDRAIEKCPKWIFLTTRKLLNLMSNIMTFFLKHPVFSNDHIKIFTGCFRFINKMYHYTKLLRPSYFESSDSALAVVSESGGGRE